jgi:tRNA nucleotidyltransferase/poly(A) polymerase
MSSPQTRHVELAWPELVLYLAEALEDAGETVLIVGGAVRDAWLRRPVRDLDLISAAGGRRLARRIADRWHGDYYPLDEARDVGRALIDTPDGRLVVDVARMRGDLDADLRDRDFTVNAMAVALHDLNALIDPLEGLEDLKAKRLRQCAPDSIANDPIRALRAVRLSMQLGLRIESLTLASVRAGAPLLARPSPERVRDELFTLLGLPRPAAGLRLLRELGLLQAVIPALHTLESDAWRHALLRVERLNGLWETISPARTDETAAQFALGMVVMALDRYRAGLQAHLGQTGSGGRTQRALLMFAGAVGALPVDGALEAGHALRLSSAEIDWLGRALRAAPVADALLQPEALAMHRYWRAAGAAGIDGLLLALADTLARQGLALDQDAWVRRLEAARVLLEAWFERQADIVAPPPLVTGTDLMRALQINAGPQVGHLLDALREAQVTGEVSTAEEALALARSLHG